MSTRNSTHWGEDPPTSVPAAENTYSTQIQSPLFRLPRELRDVVYEYYAEGRQMYGYNKETGRLRYYDAPARAENLGLMATCKIAADEMQRVAFQKAEFKTRCSTNDSPEFLELRSKAARLHYLIRLIQTQRQRMFVCVADLLEASDFTDVEARYPEMGKFLGDRLPQAAAQQVDLLRLSMSQIRGDDTVNQAYTDALLFALNCANNRNPEKFARLTSRVFGKGLCPIGNFVGDHDQHNLFCDGSLSEVLSWTSDSWRILEEEDISRLEALLCQVQVPACEPPQPIRYDLDHRFMRNTKCYFSAAAVAIDYLHGLPQQQWCNLRKLVLKEDRMSLLRPACHVRGLIPFCKSNPALRVERHIALLSNVLPQEYYLGSINPYILGSSCVFPFIPWIEETLSLSTYGMPPNAFQLIIDGSTKEAIHSFELIKYAAAIQEAMLTQAQLNGVQPTTWLQDPRTYDRFPLPWHLPADFPETVRSIMNGTSNIRFMGPVGNLWDPDTMFVDRKDWMEAEWLKEWDDKIGLGAVDSTFYQDVKGWYEL